MNSYGRQTAPPQPEVVSVTFRVWVHEFARAEVDPRFATEFESAASASRIRSVFPVGSA
jgi:hypothetical protein